jgi:hypothetical protein
VSKRIVFITSAAAAALLALAPVAHADLTDVGKSASEQLGGFAEGLFIGLVALVALGLLLTRRIQELAVFIAVAVIVGVFVLAPHAAVSAIKSTAETLTGG